MLTAAMSNQENYFLLLNELFMLILNHEKKDMKRKKGWWKSKLNDGDSKIYNSYENISAEWNEGVEMGTNPFSAIFHKEHTSW